MSVLKRIIILIIVFNSASCKNYTGKPCTAEDVTGVCRRIFECPYAVDKIDKQQKKATLCGYEETDEIACCPSQNLLHRTGIFKEYFKGSNDGVIKSNDMTCRYEGKQPVLCCENERAKPNPPEPVECASIPLPKPKLTKTVNNKKIVLEHFLWDKCVEYQRYFNKCVDADGMPGRPVRQNTCGIPSWEENADRILNGIRAKPRQFPHMAVVGCHNAIYTDEVDIIWVGGGSLISEKFILTAAHVLVENTHGRLRYALMGTLDKRDTKGLLLNIIRTLPHKQYEKGTKDHDIALLELHERVKFNEFIRPLCLPVPGREIDTGRIIVGWGETESGQSSNMLLTANVTIDKGGSCRMRFGTSFVPDRMICATGYVESRKTDTCKGDSGGPLMALFTNLNCSYSIEGVVSYGSRCGEGIGVYTRVSYYLDWIIENAWPEEWAKMQSNK